MLDKRLNDIDQSDIDDLVVNGVAENRHLEYKESLPGNSDGEKKEFLADVSSFANAGGGDIIYGISEKRDSNGKTTGVPENVVGLSGMSVDVEIRRLENILRDGLTPRLNGVQLKAIDGFPKGPVLTIRIPKSWSAPHMIAKGDSRFYSRNSAGKYPLDVSEIRAAFALSESLPEKARRFREERVARIIADETPVPLAHTSRTILHLLPLASLDPAFTIDLKLVENNHNNLRPMGASGCNFHYNFDGFVTYDGTPTASSLGYVQVFRNGVIESTESALLTYRNQQGVGVINNVRFEDRLVNALQAYIRQIQQWDIEPPYLVMLNLIGVKNHVITNRVDWFDGIHTIGRDTLMLPDILIEEGQSNFGALLRPAFDALWQASGLSGSRNYDKDGNWKARVH
ncbi:MAG TPA: ATP-binding protein [Anaerolineales bacterium]|nr:ATP-binding protein [Anaerolineales bacterium]